MPPIICQKPRDFVRLDDFKGPKVLYEGGIDEINIIYPIMLKPL